MNGNYIRKRQSQSIINSCLNTYKNTKYEHLNWNGNIKYPGLIRIQTIGDGSCFFHAIAKSYCKTYISGIRGGKTLNRCYFIRKVREDLARKLGSKIRGKNMTHYDILSNGTLKEFSKEWPPYKLENLKRELMKCQAVDNVYIEFISNQINKDIYILSSDTQDIYPTGDDYNLLYKGRNSIIILYTSGHYELIGVEENRKIYTLFEPDHPLIQMIRNRIQQVVK
jgi:hypothetical protein